MIEFDWNRIFLHGLDLSLALEVGIKTLIMFVFVLIFLRASGKKGVRQLSIFEVAIIIALGSAAGDPMLNSESAIIPSLLVFFIILIIYRLITFLTAKYQKIENILEGVPMHIIEDGMFSLAEEGDANFAKDEFFAEMRAQSIEHLGQVRTGILETNGQVSFLFYEQKEVRLGLPIFPRPYNMKSKSITEAAVYACTSCGQVLHLNEARNCPRCGKEEWVKAIGTPRIV